MVKLEQVNDFRISHGLSPLAPKVSQKEKHMQKQRQNANKAARAQANRDLKAKRNKGGK